MYKIAEIGVEQTYPIRLQVLKTNEKYQYKYKGDFLPTTKHFGVFDADKLVGIVTVMEVNNPNLKGDAVQLRGMAVCKEYQHKGLGKLLVNHIEKVYKHKDLLWCNARDYAAGFYNSLGFTTFGKKFYIKNVCYHYVMYKNLD